MWKDIKGCMGSILQALEVSVHAECVVLRGARIPPTKVRKLCQLHHKEQISVCQVMLALIQAAASALGCSALFSSARSPRGRCGPALGLLALFSSARSSNASETVTLKPRIDSIAICTSICGVILKLKQDNCPRGQSTAHGMA